MFKIDKKALGQYCKILDRIIENISTLYIQSSKEDNSLWLIVNEPSHYVKLLIPSAEVDTTALVGIDINAFKSVFSMRKDELVFSYDKDSSKLDIKCGSQISLYVLDIDKNDIEREIDADFIKIPAKKVSILRSLVQHFWFSSPDKNSNIAIFKNDKDGMSVNYATINTCSFYHVKEPIIKQDFEVCIDMDSVILMLSLISSEAKIGISDKEFIIQSEELTASIPTIEDETKGYAEYYEMLKTHNIKKGDENFKAGYIVLNSKDIGKAIDSVCSFAQSTTLVKVTIKDKKGSLYVETKEGTGKDSFKVEKNTIGDISIEIPQSYIGGTLDTVKRANDTSNFYLGYSDNYYKVYAENDNYSVMAIGPISS